MIMLAMALAVAQGPAGAVIPLSIPDNRLILVEQREERTLPAGGLAHFHQRGELRLAAADGALIATYRVVDRRCDGPQAICTAFLRLGSGVDGRIFRFRINAADHSITLIDASAIPLDADGSEAGSAVATIVSSNEAAAPGAILAADLRLLIRFAGVALPAVGHTVASPEGQLRLTALNDGHAEIAITRAPLITDAVSVFGSGDCRISRATGLVEQCRFADWVDESRTRILRARETRVTLAPLTVS